MAMQEEQLPQDVVRFHAAITQMIGNTFSYEQLVEAISICHCNKAIVVEYGTLDGATHGYSVELRDCILIVIRKRLGYTLDWFTRLHELGHAGLGHLKYVNLTRAQWHKEWKQNPKMRRTILSQELTCRSEITAYTTPRECSAETIGTLWKKSIEAHASAIPEVARDMYGYQGAEDE